MKSGGGGETAKYRSEKASRFRVERESNYCASFSYLNHFFP